ncbi:MAG TPA: 4-hydroxy-tetrahydrodipicolinate synthase [Chitinophagaceae bacterium]|jgi:4-hydroxy-tetrahydrodipicolinate synthase|nr:4-hydroxy-tetrahydrodipicolinate synthase [Chitinophagaceae bacterium]
MSLRDQLRGTGVALVTPFKQDQSIDYNALEVLINKLIEDGVQYVVSLGSTGETPVLTKEEKVEVFSVTCSIAAGRVPVVVGLAGNNTAAVVKELESFDLEKATAILSVSPYYNKPTQEGIFQHYKSMALASPKPIIIYNVPSRTGSNISAATTLRLANEFDKIAGTKEASANMIQCMHILRDRPADFFVTSGDDHVTLPLIACGMDGVISVAANCFAKDFSTMVSAALNNDYEQARLLQNKLLKGFDLLFAENNPTGVKAFLSEQGLIQNILRLPLTPASEQLISEIREYLSSSIG